MCEVPTTKGKCGNPVAMLYYRHPICQGHWDLHCNDDHPFNLKDSLSIPRSMQERLIRAKYQDIADDEAQREIDEIAKRRMESLAKWRDQKKQPVVRRKPGWGPLPEE